MADFFHQAVAWAGKEIISTDLPGELWVSLMDSPAQSELFERMPGTASESNPVISVRKALGLATLKPQDASCRVLMPYLREAMDLGYEYLMLTR